MIMHRVKALCRRGVKPWLSGFWSIMEPVNRKYSGLFLDERNFRLHGHRFSQFLVRRWISVGSLGFSLLASRFSLLVSPSFDASPWLCVCAAPRCCLAFRIPWAAYLSSDSNPGPPVISFPMRPWTDNSVVKVRSRLTAVVRVRPLRAAAGLSAFRGRPIFPPIPILGHTFAPGWSY